MAFGVDEDHVTLLISTGALTRCNREQLQGIAAHLISSIANGDPSIGLRAAMTLYLFAFMARFSRLLVEPERGRMLARIAVTMLHPTGASARVLTHELADPMQTDPAKGSSIGDKPTEPVSAPGATTYGCRSPAPS